MNEWHVITTDKKTGEETVIETFTTEEKAERFCEMWGWNYDDGVKSYWLGYISSAETV